MNYGIYALLLGLSSLVTDNALADVPTPPNLNRTATSSEEIAAQTNITRDAIDQLMRKVDSRQAGSGFNARDYAQWSQGFKKDVADSVAMFEDQVKNSVLKKLALWMDRYNTVYLSNDYSSEQKAILLSQVRAQIDGQVVNLGNEYRAAIRALYRTIGDYPYTYAWKITDCKANKKFCKSLGEVSGFDVRRGDYSLNCVRAMRFSGKTSSTANCWVSHGYSSVTVYDHTNLATVRDRTDGLDSAQLTQVFQTMTLPLLKDGCRSQICLGLKAGDIVFFAGLVRSALDRDITVKLADGRHVTIPGMNLNISLVTEQISSTAYTDVIRRMPFDTE